MTTNTLQACLGDELRQRREAMGLSRDDVLTRLQSSITDRTLYAYERGQTGISVTRFVELCHTIRAAPPTVLRQALQRARMEPDALHVNLYAIVSDQSDELASIRQWAWNRLSKDTPSNGVARVPLDAIPEMAAMSNCPPHTLIAYLSDFPPEPSAPH